VWWEYISPSCFGPHSLHTWMYLLQFDSCPCFGGVPKVNCTRLLFPLPTSLPFYPKEKTMQKHWELVPKMGYLYSWWCRGFKVHYSLPKGIHSFIHSSKLNTICNCTIQYLQKEQAISFCSSMTQKKLNTNLQAHIFFYLTFYAKNKSRNLFLFVHSWPTTQ
jgi:hypothetical protein